MIKTILITGGPVHAYLDDVKIITNKFRGGLMAKLAEDLYEKGKIEVLYLTSKGSKLPDIPNVAFHEGIEDYMEKVKKLSQDVDAVVLGAAVANFIPKNKIKGKFPSHDYKPGDTIPIDFTIAPRIIDEVKKVNPKVHLFGFKLLSDVSYNELVRAAYGVLLESKAVTVFANDAMALLHKYAITKERGVHPIHNNEVADWIINRINESYYKTFTNKIDGVSVEKRRAQQHLDKLLIDNKLSFFETEEGMWFGSGAVKYNELEEGFATTARGKNELEDYAFVDSVNHETMEVFCDTTKKASLNAPLFHFIFNNIPEAYQILHFHHERQDLITLDYATPGTDTDSIRLEALKYPSFNIKGHGCILTYNKEGELIK